ncbi:MAG: histidine phosphatase family protein [Candidatus Buchananbacteria bacterium]
MKWPTSLLLIRHDVSAYNQMKVERAKDPLYQRFVKKFDQNWQSYVTRSLALEVNEKWALKVSDPNTPLLEINSDRTVSTGRNLRLHEALPDVIFVSPYLRTKQTLEALKIGWPELSHVRVYEEERIREQNHGLASLYNDWRVYFALHPEQKMLYDLDGAYWHTWQQGENRPMVRDRLRSWTITLSRDFANRRVMYVGHHLGILCFRANHERWDDSQFREVDEKDKPINCGVTKYAGIPNIGSNGRFALEYYNRDFSDFAAI